LYNLVFASFLQSCDNIHKTVHGIKLKMKPATHLLLVSTVLLVSFALAGCSSIMGSSLEPTSTIPVSIENATISASGEFVPHQVASLSFANGAQSIQIQVSVGEQVSAGKLLAAGDTVQWKVGILQAQSAVQRAELALQQLEELPAPDAVAGAETALANAQVNLDRLERANATEIELNAARAQVNSAQMALNVLKAGASDAQLSASRADVSAAKGSLEQANAQLAAAEIRAPFSGVIVEIYANNYENLTPGQPVFLLADLTKMQVVTIDLNEVDAARLKPDDHAFITIDALPGVTLEGTIERIAEKASGGSGVYYTAVIDIPEIPDGVRWKMSAFVEFKPKP
jgi:multidrug efflux pump subunit AcrA (membrane-fusion protein)